MREISAPYAFNMHRLVHRPYEEFVVTSCIVANFSRPISGTGSHTPYFITHPMTGFLQNSWIHFVLKWHCFIRDGSRGGHGGCNPLLSESQYNATIVVSRSRIFSKTFILPELAIWGHSKRRNRVSNPLLLKNPGSIPVWLKTDDLPI